MWFSKTTELFSRNECHINRESDKIITGQSFAYFTKIIMIRKRFYFYFMQKSSLFDKAFRILLILLPFTTLITVFTKEKLGIQGIGFYKECILLFMLAYIAYMHFIKKIKLSFSWFD
jgi:hypothetical protein